MKIIVKNKIILIMFSLFFLSSQLRADFSFKQDFVSAFNQFRGPALASVVAAFWKNPIIGAMCAVSLRLIGQTIFINHDIAELEKLEILQKETEKNLRHSKECVKKIETRLAGTQGKLDEAKSLLTATSEMNAGTIGTLGSAEKSIGETGRLLDEYASRFDAVESRIKAQPAKFTSFSIEMARRQGAVTSEIKSISGLVEVVLGVKPKLPCRMNPVAEVALRGFFSDRTPPAGPQLPATPTGAGASTP